MTFKYISYYKIFDMMKKSKQLNYGTSLLRNFSSLRKGSTKDHIMMITASKNRRTKIIPNK